MKTKITRRATKLRLTYRVFKAYGMFFLRLATLDEEYSVSVRILTGANRPTRFEFVSALHRLLLEMKRSA